MQSRLPRGEAPKGVGGSLFSRQTPRLAKIVGPKKEENQKNLF
jgi:hypothetical protein